MEDNGREIGRETTILKNKDKNMQNTILIILLIIVLISIWFFYIDRKINIIKLTPKIEYKIEYIDDYSFYMTMKNIGDQGWELVFARRATSDDEYGYECIFKRPKK